MFTERSCNDSKQQPAYFPMKGSDCAITNGYQRLPGRVPSTGTWFECRRGLNAAPCGEGIYPRSAAKPSQALGPLRVPSGMNPLATLAQQQVKLWVAGAFHLQARGLNADVV
jgi:hypothetical protein